MINRLPTLQNPLPSRERHALAVAYATTPDRQHNGNYVASRHPTSVLRTKVIFPVGHYRPILIPGRRSEADAA